MFTVSGNDSQAGATEGCRLPARGDGQSPPLSARSGEKAKASVIDGCILNDKNNKCDALYLFRGVNKKVAALVELKGASDIPHAFEQLAYTRKYRPEYCRLREQLNESGPGQLVEKAFIVTNGMLSKPKRERLENHHGIRVNEILQSEPSTKTPDLRRYF